MITKEQLQKGRELSNELGAIESDIADNANKIIRIAFDVYNCKLDWWDWDDYEEGTTGFQWDNIGDVMVEYTTHMNGGYRTMHCDINGTIFDLSESFPVEWLFEDLSEIENQIKKGKETQEAKEAEKRLKKAQQRAKLLANQKVIKETAKAKLTAKERKALGV